MSDLLLPPEFEIFGPDDVESIDWDNPISDDPLNDGPQMWMLAGQGIPGGFGGDKWIDLTRRHVGTLTNMDPATDWVGTSNPGGWGSARTNEAFGANAYINCGDPDSLDFGSSDWTVSLWFCVGATTKYVDLLSKRANVSATEAGWSLKLLNTNGTINGYFGDGTGGTGGAGDNFGFSDALDDGKWHHLVLLRSGGNLNGAIDGTLGTPYSLSSSGSVSNSETFKIGRLVGQPPDNVNDIRVHNRALSATEVRDLYNRSKQYQAGLLNRIQVPRYVPVAGGLSIPIAAYHYNHHLGSMT